MVYNHEAYKRFKLKNDERMKTKIICDICGGSYNYSSKWEHNKTKKHIFNKKLIELQEEKKININ